MNKDDVCIWLCFQWASQISIHMIAISDFRDTLGFEMSDILSKIWLDLIAISTKSAEIRTLVFSIKKGIPIIFE